MVDFSINIFGADDTRGFGENGELKQDDGPETSLAFLESTL
jgi:hypothetical protein